MAKARAKPKHSTTDKEQSERFLKAARAAEAAETQAEADAALKPVLQSKKKSKINGPAAAVKPPGCVKCNVSLYFP